MKILAILITICSSIAFAASSPLQPSSASQIPLGPRMLVHALGQAHTGTLQVESVGFKTPPPIVTMNLKGLLSDEILGAFSLENFLLRFKNPNEFVVTRGEILDRNGKVLFKAEHWWKCQKSFDKKGKAIYQVPEYAENLWFSLQDISLPFNGKSAKAYLNGGEIITLDIGDGEVTVPGFLAYSQGVLEVQNGNQKKFFDLQTGSNVIRPRFTLTSQALGFDNLQSLNEVAGSIQIQTYFGNQTVYEAIPISSNGTLNITTQENYIEYSEPVTPGVSDISIPSPYPGPLPTGLWLSIDNEWKYFTPTIDGAFTVPVQKKKVIYFYFVWNDDTSGKG